jgi:hypothetical protein
MKRGLKMLLETSNQYGIHPDNNNIINIDKEKNNTRRCLAKNKEESCFAEKKIEARWLEIYKTRLEEPVSIHIKSLSTYRHMRKNW